MTVAELIAKLQEMPQDALVTAMDGHTDLPFEYKGDFWQLYPIGFRNNKWWWVTDDPRWQAHNFEKIQMCLVFDPDRNMG